jgi:replicative DNA helicase
LKSHYDVHAEKIKKRIEFSKDSNFYVSSITDITTLNIESDLLTLKNQNINIDVIIIDYLQLMNTIEDTGNRVQEISKLTRELKKIALRSNVLLISLSQLSRELEKRSEKTPYLSDLRESGSIEQDSDIVMFVYRHEYYKSTERKNEVDIIIAKQRNGGLGTIQMICELPKSLFTDMVR